MSMSSGGHAVVHGAWAQDVGVCRTSLSYPWNTAFLALCVVVLFAEGFHFSLFSQLSTWELWCPNHIEVWYHLASGTVKTQHVQDTKFARYSQHLFPIWCAHYIQSCFCTKLVFQIWVCLCNHASPSHVPESASTGNGCTCHKLQGLMGRKWLHKVIELSPPGVRNGSFVDSRVNIMCTCVI